ncbi:MAG: tRNA dihydrouridine synthase DusB [Fimbriimonadaceae bacterium]|nr:tRNA dihydrouridine synthase DusB [Fimbriimonadaceae bacterium]
MSAFNIGPVPIENRLILAPMEDVSNLPMRTIAKRIGGPGLMFTEFVSAMAIHYNAKKTYKKLAIADAERPLGIQIFGGDAETMVETAKVCADAGCDVLDINMGCWVPKVVKTGSGAALLKDADLATEIVSKVVRAVPIPVTVKVRAGWDYSLFAAPNLARRFQDAGAQMITLHARFAKQGFDGQADWDLIRAMRESVTVPLVGNGDVKTPDDAERMLRETGCDAVMVGRAAISNPWALRDIRLRLSGEPPLPPPTLTDRIATALEHLRLMIEYEGDELKAVRHLRGQIPMYIKGEPGAAEVRGHLTRCSSYGEMASILNDFAGRSNKVRETLASR